MSTLIHYLVRYGVSLVFLNVFAEQIGMPVPAVPTLIVAGALARNGRMSSTHTILIAAVAASLIADWIWFLLGRRYGYRILRTLCRISLSPDSCVRDTEARFERWGMKSLLFAKFVPGFSTVAPPLAGASPLVAGARPAADPHRHRHARRRDRQRHRGDVARPRDRAVLHVTERSLGRPCGAPPDRSRVQAGAAARRRF